MLSRIVCLSKQKTLNIKKCCDEINKRTYAMRRGYRKKDFYGGTLDSAYEKFSYGMHFIFFLPLFAPILM